MDRNKAMSSSGRSGRRPTSDRNRSHSNLNQSNKAPSQKTGSNSSCTITSQAWLAAIQNATCVVRPDAAAAVALGRGGGSEHRRAQRKSSSSSSSNKVTQLQVSLEYLDSLALILEESLCSSSEWNNDLPTMDPPPFPSSHQHAAKGTRRTGANGGRKSGHHHQQHYQHGSTLPPVPTVSVPTSIARNDADDGYKNASSSVVVSNNRYATFQDNDTSSDDDDTDDNSTSNGNHDFGVLLPTTPTTAATTEASSALSPTGNHTHSPDNVADSTQQQRKSNNSNSNLLSMRRLMIRIVTAQSEVLACQASSLAPPQWQEGANLYQASLWKLHHALSLADSECAAWLGGMRQDHESGDGHNNDALFPSFLQQDATIVEVAIEYLTNQTSMFRQRAIKLERQLLNRLEPQWESRNAVMERIGMEKWRNNPNPRRDYAAIRAADEEQLKQVQAALEALNDLDTDGLLESSLQFKQQVAMASSKQKNRKVRAKKEKQAEKQRQKQRYNGQRPTDLSKRLSFSEYPDPTEFGWTFTGSADNVVEFFERRPMIISEDEGINVDTRSNDDRLVKLDWYFTTGTIKTSLVHPKRGKTQLFGSKVTANIYLEIMINPRAHTNSNRYHEKRRRNRRGNHRRGNRNRQEQKPTAAMWS